MVDCIAKEYLISGTSRRGFCFSLIILNPPGDPVKMLSFRRYVILLTPPLHVVSKPVFFMSMITSDKNYYVNPSFLFYMLLRVPSELCLF